MNVNVCVCPCDASKCVYLFTIFFYSFMSNIRLFDRSMQKKCVWVCVCVCLSALTWVNEANPNKSHTIKYLSETVHFQFVFIFKRSVRCVAGFEYFEIAIVCHFVLGFWISLILRMFGLHIKYSGGAAAVRSNHASNTHP